MCPTSLLFSSSLNCITFASFAIGFWLHFENDCATSCTQRDCCSHIDCFVGLAGDNVRDDGSLAHCDDVTDAVDDAPNNTDDVDVDGCAEMDVVCDDDTTKGDTSLPIYSKTVVRRAWRCGAHSAHTLH